MKVGLKLFEIIVDSLWANRQELAEARRELVAVGTEDPVWTAMWKGMPTKAVNYMRGRETGSIIHLTVRRHDVWFNKATLRSHLKRQLFLLHGAQ